MRNSNRLTATTVKNKRKPGRYGDGGGLWLQVSQAGTKAWLFRYMLNGRARHMGLGPVDLVSLGEAREKARRCRRQLLDGIDPIEARNGERIAARLSAARGISFKTVAEQYIAANASGWANAKHASQWRNTLGTYAYPEIGELPVGEVDTAAVLRVLEPIWSEKPETAGRVRGRIENILDRAKVLGHRASNSNNPARWRGHLDKLLPARSRVRATKHHAALPWRELPGFMVELRQREAVTARALEFAILTAARTGEVIKATWAEFDLDNAIWTVPAERMKARKEHRVPLSDRALEILRALPREDDNGHVFIGPKAGEGLSNNAMLKLLERMGRGDLTTHGFRSTFRDWCAESTGYPHELAEMALAHVIGDKAEKAYRRGDLFNKRRQMMAAWAKYGAEKPRGKADVVPIRGAQS